MILVVFPHPNPSRTTYDYFLRSSLCLSSPATSHPHQGSTPTSRSRCQKVALERIDHLVLDRGQESELVWPLALLILRDARRWYRLLGGRIREPILQARVPDLVELWRRRIFVLPMQIRLDLGVCKVPFRCQELFDLLAGIC